MVKNKASMAVKNMISVLTSLVKSKLMGVKSKADAMKVRLMVFSLLKTKKFSLGSLSNKIQTLLDKKGNDDKSQGGEDESKAIVLYEGSGAGSTRETHLDYYYPPLQLGYYNYGDDDDESKYPDLTHCLFDEEEEEEMGGSVIDIVKNSKEQEGGDFNLEDEIDNVADLFITRFKKHMRLEKLESFKRYQAMLGRTA